MRASTRRDRGHCAASLDQALGVEPCTAPTLGRLPRIPRGRREVGLRLRETLWGAWAWMAFAALFALLWLPIVLAPSRVRAWRVARSGARLLLRITGTRITVSGLEHLRGVRRPCVVVANHTSELDVIALAAALPIPLAPVAKEELGRMAALRWPLERVGVVFVRRDAARAAASQIETLVERLRAGQDVLIFPEGTFRRTSGLLPFHRGAFLAAALAGVPVVPVVVRGARAMTPAERALPRPGAIEIEVGAPLEPAGGAVESAARELLAASRRFLLERTGEADVARPPRESPPPVP